VPGDELGIGRNGGEREAETRPAGPAEAERPGAETPGTEAEGEGAAGGAGSCTITSRTAVHAPDGTADDRTIIGVHETVLFSVGGQAADWTVRSGWPTNRRGRTSFEWAAPTRPGTYTINATIPASGETCSLDMNVVAPSRIRMRRRTSLAAWYAAGTAGAGMTTVVRLYPRNVNFGWISILEVPGPASNVTGYFLARQRAGANLNHVPNPNYVRVGWNNNLCCDTAATRPGVLPAPWSVGTWDWVIPMRYRYFNATSGGRRFTRVVQRFRITAAGRVTVSKAGASIPRSP
jgi:hypothetical protein